MDTTQTPQYKIASKGMRGSFDILDAQDHLVTAMEYEDWFSSKGTATIGADTFSIKSRNMWCSNFDILKNEEDIGDLTINWKGHIILKLQERLAPEKVFILKTTGFWNFYFILEDSSGKEILALKQTLKWSKMNYDYAVYLADAENIGIPIERLLLLCGYSANLMMIMMDSIAAAV